MYKAIIEMPMGDNRRRHLNYENSGFIDLGPIKDVIPVNDGIMPIHYGFIKGTINKEETEEHPEALDVLVFDDRKTEVGEELEIKPLAFFERKDGDHKVIAVVVDNKAIQKWEDISESTRKLIFDYFGYKSPIAYIGNQEEAEQLILKCLISV